MEKKKKPATRKMDDSSDSETDQKKKMDDSSSEEEEEKKAEPVEDKPKQSFKLVAPPKNEQRLKQMRELNKKLREGSDQPQEFNLLDL